nr:hypothetical protein [Tanacetum cinerariifolium]
MVEEDVVDHIAKVLEVLDPIKVDGMDPFQLRMMTFPLSHYGKARKWWMNEGYGKINTGLDPLEFITWRNSKFKDHKKVDEMTKRALLCSWDITEHIGKELEITIWIKIPNVDKDELRLHVFSKSLSRDAKKWWNNEGAATT